MPATNSTSSDDSFAVTLLTLGLQPPAAALQHPLSNAVDLPEPALPEGNPLPEPALPVGNSLPVLALPVLALPAGSPPGELTPSSTSTADAGSVQGAQATAVGEQFATGEALRSVVDQFPLMRGRGAQDPQAGQVLGARAQRIPTSVAQGLDPHAGVVAETMGGPATNTGANSPLAMNSARAPMVAEDSLPQLVPAPAAPVAQPLAQALAKLSSQEGARNAPHMGPDPQRPVAPSVPRASVGNRHSLDSPQVGTAGVVGDTRVGVLGGVPTPDSASTPLDNGSSANRAVERHSPPQPSASYARSREPMNESVPDIGTTLPAAASARGLIANGSADANLIAPPVAAPAAAVALLQEYGLGNRVRWANQGRAAATQTTSEPRGAVRQLVEAPVLQASIADPEATPADNGRPLPQPGGMIDATVHTPNQRAAEAPGQASAKIEGNFAMPDMAKLAGGDGLLPEQMVRRVLQAQAQNQNVLRIQLQPFDLGQLEIQLKVQGDQLNLTFMAQQASTKELLESYLPNLRQLLGDSGLQLGDVDVRQQEQSAGHSARQGSGEVPKRSNEFVHTADAQEHLPTPRAGHDGVIDAFA
jgi:hypothetical protein